MTKQNTSDKGSSTKTICEVRAPAFIQVYIVNTMAPSGGRSDRNSTPVMIVSIADMVTEPTPSEATIFLGIILPKRLMRIGRQFVRWPWKKNSFQKRS
jgi:hypothetical protein